MSKSKMGYEQLVAECKRLRSEAERSEARFLAFLIVAEREYAPEWGSAGAADFEQFLRSNSLCDTDRYRLFRDGADKVGVDVAIQYGAHWAMQVGKMRDSKTSVISEFADRAAKFQEVNAVSPSEQVVTGWRQELEAAERAVAGESPKRVRAQLQVDELHKLRAENEKLKASLRAAERRVTQLESELAEVRRKGQSTQPTAS